MLREINEESVSSLLEKKDALASCDVAAFVYDRYGIVVVLEGIEEKRHAGLV